MSEQTFPTWPYFAEDEIAASFRVLQSAKVNYWTGEEGRLFEREFAEYTGCQHAIALANGSVALQVALHGLGIAAGDDVVVTARTFVASVSSIVLSGATPVFADVDINSQNVTAASIAAVITPRTRAIICVHLAGWPCEMDEIIALAKKRKLSVIEDCAQAHGAQYKERSVGSLGDVAAWSFCQDKIMSTAGEGGMVTTSNTALYQKMWSYKDHGKDFDKAHAPKMPDGYNWIHDSIGTNYRMTEVQSAIGRVQLAKLPQWHDKRASYAEQIWEEARKHPLFYVAEVPDYISHAAYKCYVFIKEEELGEGWCRDDIINAINVLGVPCFHGSCSEVYLEKAFKNHSSLPDTRLDVCKHLGETSVMFQVHPTLTKDHIAKTCRVLASVARLASRAKNDKYQNVCLVD